MRNALSRGLAVALCAPVAAAVCARSGAAEDADATVVADDGHGESPSLEWDPEWRRYSRKEMVVGFSAAAVTVIVATTWSKPDTARWRGDNRLDARARAALGGDRHSARARAGWASDGLMWALIAYPLVDAGAAWLGPRGDGDTAWQMAVISGQAYAFTQLVGQIIKRAAARERPFVPDCDSDLPHESCTSADLNQSFYSGHTAMSFTSAGLVCAHHQALPLYRGGAGDRAACATAVGAAATVGILRVVADEHYASDVLVGATVGFASGYLFPRLYHYRRRGDDEPERAWARSVRSVTPQLAPSSVGLTVGGAW